MKKVLVRRKFRVLPGSEITFCFDFTGMILEQFGEDWIEDPHCPCCLVLKQPDKDINGKICAIGGSVSIDRKYLFEVTNVQTPYTR